jgi:hypothetical protein
MKRPIVLFFAALTASTLLTAAMVRAQIATAPPNTYYGEHHPYTERFDSFLDSHRDIQSQLARDPRLIDNKDWVRSHPELHQYLHNHPNVAGTFRSHPNRFMHRENRYQSSEQRWDRRHGMPN